MPDAISTGPRASESVDDAALPPVTPTLEGAASLPELSLGLGGCFEETTTYRTYSRPSRPVCSPAPRQDDGARTAARDQQRAQAAASASRCAALQMRQHQGLAFGLCSRAMRCHAWPAAASAHDECRHMLPSPPLLIGITVTKGWPRGLPRGPTAGCPMASGRAPAGSKAGLQSGQPAPAPWQQQHPGEDPAAAGHAPL